MLRAAGLVGLALAAGCRNACQEICVRMADYAEECELPVSDGEIDACLERHSANVEKEDLAACQDFGDGEVIRAQWSCEELGRYWSSGGGDPTAR
jgi:hypothetical protein